MTFVLTSEFDFLRRDAFHIAKRLQDVGKLAGVSDVKAADHGWSFIGNTPKVHKLFNEWKDAFEAYTGPEVSTQ